MLLKKIQRVFENGLIPVFCIGETLEEREEKKQFDIVSSQLREVFLKLSDEQMRKSILAYEPVWAIGTGKTATADQAQEMHHFIRSLIRKEKGNGTGDSIRILYGGSCNAQNAAALFAQPDIDGGLIGGASLKAGDFVQIIRSV